MSSAPEENARENDPLTAARICTAMMRVGTRMATLFDQRFAPLGMTQAQFRTLLAVADYGGERGISPSELAEHLLLDRATVTLITSRLVKSGHLERRPGENRRTFRLVLTQEGRQQVGGIIPLAIQLADTTLERFTGEELPVFERLLQKLETHIRETDLVTRDGENPETKQGGNQ